MSVHSIAAVVASTIILASEAIYIRGIFVPDPRTGERVRPSRSTFWILTLLQGMLAASYYHSGGGLAAGLSLAYALGFLPIAILSLRYGYDCWRRTDTVCLVGAIGSALAWWGASALLATVLLLLTDFFGIYPTLQKARSAPHTEERIAWLLTLVATAVNFFAIEGWETADLLYSPYLFAINALIAYYVWRPRRGGSPQAREHHEEHLPEDEERRHRRDARPREQQETLATVADDLAHGG